MIFDKVMGSISYFDSFGITDSSANFKTDYYAGWYAKVNGVDHLITSNDTTTLYFNNGITSATEYEILYVSRGFIETYESDMSNIVMIPEDLLNRKYDVANMDISNEITAVLRQYYYCGFDPTQNILNPTIMQSSFAYHVLDLIYRDLMIDGDSFQAFKSMEVYRRDYNAALKTGLSLLQVDFNQNGTSDGWEVRGAPGTFVMGR